MDGSDFPDATDLPWAVYRADRLAHTPGYAAQGSCCRLRCRRARLPPSRAECLAHSHGHKPSPGPIGAEIGGAQVFVARAQAVEQEVLGHAKFESFIDINPDSPRMFNADRIGRPRIECLRNRLAEQESGSSVHHEPAQRTPAKRTNLENSRKHIAREQTAGRVHPAVLAGVAGAKIGINLVMRRGEVKLGPAPEHVSREKHAVVRSRIVPSALRRLGFRSASR